MSPRKIAGALLAVAAALAFVAYAVPAANAAPGFVERQGGDFVLNGQQFRFGGTNNYYLHYKSALMVDDVLADAAAMDLKVLRSWTFLECGGAKPNSAGGCSQGADLWMQRWSSTTNAVEYNEGPNGLQKLDHLVAEAGNRGIKLILVLTGNWQDFGGMDQYVTWYGLANHDQFFTDARIRQDYKNWASRLINRTNSVTGVPYKNDPTIFSWELANEPRCINASLPTSGTCTASTITNWVTEMSGFIKGLDANHMVSVGDEGFHPGVGGTSSSWPYNVTDGVDHAALTALPDIDFGTYHMYPQGWGQSPIESWGTGWINDHNAVGTSIGKPEVLEEFGITDPGTRDAVYTSWTDAVRAGGGDGWMVWILTGIQDDGQLYPDFDGFRVVFPSSTATVLSNAAVAIGGPLPSTSPTGTGPPSTSPTAAPTTSPPGGAGACRITYATNDWNTGFTASLTLANTGSTAINGWTLRFTFPGSQQVTQGWSATWTQTAASVTATSLSWNGTLAPNASTSIGFNGSHTGSNPGPTSFTLNGTTCTAG